jgi:hypothetical protein
MTLGHDASFGITKEGQPRPYRQTALPFRAMIGGNLAKAAALADSGVHAACDTVGQKMSAAALDAVDEIVFRRKRDCRPHRSPSVLSEQTRQLAIDVFDEATGGRRGCLADAGEFEGARVANGDVAAGPNQHDGIVRRSLIELGSMRMTANIQFCLVVPTRENPLPRTGSGCP